jgi:hypothetical protein
MCQLLMYACIEIRCVVVNEGKRLHAALLFLETSIFNGVFYLQ